MTSGLFIPPESFVSAEILTRTGDLRASRSNMRCFLELCSLLEASVLFEDLYTYTVGEMLRAASFPLCYQLHKGGVLKEAPSFTVTYPSGVDISGRLEIVNALADRLLLEHERSNDNDAIRRYGLFHDIELEAITFESGLGYKPLTMRDMVKPMNAETLQAQSELVRIYDSLTLQLKEKQRLRFDRGYPYKVFIPPIAAIILERARDVEHIPEAMMDVREEFKRTRKKFKQLETVFCDDSYSLADVIEAEKELRYLSGALLSENESAEEVRVGLLRDLGSFLIKSLLKMGIDFESLFKLLSTNAAEWVDRTYKRRGALLLLDVSRKYKSIRHYGALIENVFGFSFTDNDLRVMRHYEALHKMDLKIDLDRFSKGLLIHQGGG
jgi:hypothetical protein